MKRMFLFLLLILPSYAMAQTIWQVKPSPNMCRGIAPGGTLRWTPCPVAWQREIIRQGRQKDVSPGSMAFRQDVAANKPALPKPKAEEKAKPIILDEAKRKDLRLAALELDNARFRLKEAQDNVTKAESAVADFWRSVGIANPAELQTKWEASNGQNGDIILTPKKEMAEKPKP